MSERTSTLSLWCLSNLVKIRKEDKQHVTPLFCVIHTTSSQKAISKRQAPERETGRKRKQKTHMPLSRVGLWTTWRVRMFTTYIGLVFKTTSDRKKTKRTRKKDKTTPSVAVSHLVRTVVSTALNCPMLHCQID